MRDFEPVDNLADPQTQRRIALNSALAIVVALFLLGWGWMQRTSAVNAIMPYDDETSGIRAQIPVDWLLSQGEDETVFRVQNPSARPFKTTIQVSIETVGPDAVPRNVVDLLKLQGPLKLPGYTPLSEERFTLGEDEAVRINYAYFEVELNPFLETAPIVVRGEDVVVLRGNQAIIITYREADQNFEKNHFYFDNFLRTLEY